MYLTWNGLEKKANRKIRIPITTSCDASHAEYLYRIKNRAIERHINMKKNVSPLHNDLDSRTMTPANIQKDIKNAKKVNCHIVSSLYLS